MRPIGSTGRFLTVIPAAAALAVSGLLTATASASTTASAGAGAAAGTGAVSPAAHRLPDFGNPDGHASVPQAGAAVNTRFLNNRCYQSGPDLGGAAIRALAQYRNRAVYITRDTFSGGRCSNGGALSSIGVSWMVLNSVMTNNKAIGYGANPASPGTAGGGSGGAIYTDGNKYSVKVVGTVIRNDHAREGGGAIFYVSDNDTGWLTIKNSTLHGNPSAVFWTRPYPGIFFHSKGHPRVVNSTIS